MHILTSPLAPGYLEALRTALEHAESVLEFYETYHWCEAREQVRQAGKVTENLRDRLRTTEWQALRQFSGEVNQ